MAEQRYRAVLEVISRGRTVMEVPSVEAAVLELRRQRPYWGPRRIALELGRRVSRSGGHICPKGR